MQPHEAFLITLAIGSAVGFVFCIMGVVAFTIDAWARLLEAITAAFHRYAVRDMIVTAYYSEQDMRHVRRFELPKPYLVEMAKKHKEATK